MPRNEKITIFLKDCLADALIKKMQEKPFEKITVDDVAQLAGVGRATYFRHFSSKQELLTYKIVRHWETNAEKRNLKERNRFDLNNAKDFFEINYLLKDVLSLICSLNLQATLFDAFDQIMLPFYNENVAETYRGWFHAYGLFGMLENWIKNDFRETPDEMANIIKQTVLR